MQVSTDGKNWSEPVAEGNFENNGKPKTVTLAKPVKGRFIRFTALSSQNGQDFAAAAEFSVSAE
ncbi:F5/8 type C domain protein [compost metagenome]